MLHASPQSADPLLKPVAIIAPVAEAAAVPAGETVLHAVQPHAGAVPEVTFPPTSHRSIKARAFGLFENSFMFRQHVGEEKMKPPREYPELAPYDVKERILESSPGFLSFGRSEVSVWEKKAEAGKPHYILFNGRAGHWGDTGPSKIPVEGLDRQATLKFLQKIAKTGAGFTAVTMRGYGNNKGTPGEAGFRRDIKAVVDDWMDSDCRVPANRLIVAGVSMGTACAAITATELTQRGEAPAMIALVNPFASMAKLAEEFIRQHKWARRLKLNLLAETLDANILRHTFRTEKELPQNMRETGVCIITSGQDTLINTKHSDILAKVAEDNGFKVFHKTHPQRNHWTLTADEMLKPIQEAYIISLNQKPLGAEAIDTRVLRKEVSGQPGIEEQFYMRDGVVARQKLFTVGVRPREEEKAPASLAR